VRAQLVLSVTAVFLLAGCSAAPTTAPTQTPGASTNTRVEPTSSSATSTATASTDAPLIEDSGEHLDASEISEAQGEATKIADAAMRLYARPETPAAAWLSDLYPMLSARAQTALATVNPTSIPATTVTGPATASPDDWGTFGTVRVPTDAGIYLVIVVRMDDASPWRVDRFTLEGVQ
jgi:hypothetical protein